MDASNLARWTRFAAKGGIGTCTALQDCVAQGGDDLMFLKDDEVVVLLQLPEEDQFLGYCEGVVGRFHGSAVRFHSKLKKPVFAKRQSSIGTSPSRPISLSARSPPPTSSSPASASGSRSVTSPTSSDTRPTTRHISSARLSASESTPLPVPSLGAQSHHRTPSNASSASHYSTRSRSFSQSRDHAPLPVPAHLHSHARKASTASSRSTYSSGSRPPSRAPSRSESVTGSEDTHTQQVSVPPPLPATQHTPSLTDGSSAHSSFIFSPMPAYSPFPQALQGLGKAPASLFQGRHRSGSEKLLSRTVTPEGRRRSGSEDALMLSNRAREDECGEREQAREHVTLARDSARQDMSAAGLSETSFRSVSVYSDASAEGEDVGARSFEAGKAGEGLSLASGDHDVLNEDESDEDDDARRVLASSPENLSDGGFGIGMTLLRDDDEEVESDSGELDGDREDDETAVGHGIPSKDELEKIQTTRRLRTFAMRVVNRGSVSSSGTETESEAGEDDTIMPPAVRQHVMSAPTSEFQTSSSSDTVLPLPRSPAVVMAPRPPFATHASSSTVGSRASSLAPTDDEHWSDADIFDDYRYSRYSTHYSGSPAQHSSRRASKGSTKSGRSRTSERPPLPEEDGWKKNLTGRESTEEAIVPQRKSVGSERSSAGKLSSVTGTDRRSVLSSSTTLNHSSAVSPIRAGGTASVVEGRPETSTRVKHRTPSPVQNVTEITVPATPGDVSMTSIASPLTRAFRHSDDSRYSRTSENIEVDTDAREQHQGSPVFPTRHLPSPDLENQLSRSRSRSPAFASSIREKMETERRAKSPNLEVAHTPLTVSTSRAGDEPNVVVMNESSASNGAHESRSLSPTDGTHLRVASPLSNHGSAPPSPLNPGFPPSPSSMAIFAPTPPLTITKSPLPSPSAPRQPASPPAIPFIGVPPPGRPPAHMQYAQHPHQSLPPSLQQQQRSGHGVSPSESLHSAMEMAGQQRASTIHGRTQTDLLTATGPVPISFLLPGMLPPPSPGGSSPGALPRPQPAAQPAPYGQIPPHTRGSMPGSISDSRATSPPSQSREPRPSQEPLTSSLRTTMRRTMTAPAPPQGSPTALGPGAFPVMNNTSPMPSRINSVPVVQPNASATPPAPAPMAAPLPRANFFPKVGQVRPRSRSFSGFKSDITEMVSQTLGKRSHEEGSQPFRAPANSSRPGSPSSRIPASLQPASPSNGSARGKPGQASRPSHGPSPLSLPPTTNIIQSSPESPLTAYTVVPLSPTTRLHPGPVRSPDGMDAQPKRGALRQASSHLSLRPGPQMPTPMASPTAFTFPPQRRNSGSAKHEDDQLLLEPPSPLKPSAARQSHESERTHNSINRSDRTSPPPFPNSSASSSPLMRGGSLRSKISLSVLKPKGAARSIREGATEAPVNVTGQSTSLADEDTVQIKDLEFELVRPAVPYAPADSLRSEEGTGSGDVLSVGTMDLRHDSSSVRSGALSPGGVSPASDQRVLGAMNASADSFSRKIKGADPSISVQAHRDRELKWISTMNSNEAAQARKSKKVKKLLIEGVPSSVRYLVWAHISNSGSKKMPNVYAQLSKRRPTMARDIERDVEHSFPDHPHLRDPKGPLVSVLFAYIAMVPDLRYHRGLAIIAGHLLLQSPEEDAFWTFLAMMDSYLRPYFMTTSPQMGIDTNLFVKAVEAADSQLASRVFGDLNVRPQELCGVWFSSVFAGTLPLEHLHRVWDLFLYEGIPFLFRVGLALLSISRRYLLEAPISSTTSYTAYLLRPPPEALPVDPEQFIAQALAVKLKDDDIRKSRVKMEAAVKQQQRVPRMSTSQPSHPHLQGGRIRVS